MSFELTRQVSVRSLELRERRAVDSLIRLFNITFEDTNTQLVRGDGEPVYQPATRLIPYHQILFAHGFFNSALHEVAHWCIAGAQRRTQVDYGYWYCPDGRDEQQQQAFEQVEVKPQAIEWAFSAACGRSFSVSTDNLDGVEPDRARFTQSVQQQLDTYFKLGFPSRAQQFIDACVAEFDAKPLSFSACLSINKDLA